MKGSEVRLVTGVSTAKAPAAADGLMSLLANVASEQESDQNAEGRHT